MNPLDIEKVCDYVNENIVDFQTHRIRSLNLFIPGDTP